MYTINNKNSLLYITLLLHIHGVLSTDYIRGENATLTCNARDQPIRRIVWYYEYGGSSEQVTTWTDGSGPPSDSGQWHSRTELDTETGNVIILNLEVIDDGTYTCRYDTIQVSFPGKQGDTHNVNIIGKLIII